jgi:hypothetical protein
MLGTSDTAAEHIDRSTAKTSLNKRVPYLVVTNDFNRGTAHFALFRKVATDFVSTVNTAGKPILFLARIAVANL